MLLLFRRSECIIETPSVFGRYVFLSLSTYFILIPPPPPLPEPSAVILYHYANAIYAACAHTLCTASAHITVQMHQYTGGALESWRNILKKTYAAMHRNPSHQHDHLLP